MTAKPSPDSQPSLRDGTPRSDHVAHRPLSREQIEVAIRTVDRSAFLVEPRVLRRVIRQDRGIGLMGRHAASRRSYAISGSRAASFLDPDEIGLAPGEPLPEELLLIARPESSELADHHGDRVLRDVWRSLFRARIQSEIQKRVDRGLLTRAEIRSRVDQIGQAEFDEFRLVLRQDQFIDDSSDAGLTYSEFVALYCELRCFAPNLLECYFPTLQSPERMDAIIAEDVDLFSWLARSRPTGAAEIPSRPLPLSSLDVEHESPESLEAQDTSFEPWLRTRWAYRLLMRKANQAIEKGNHVRAAIRRLRAARFAPQGREETIRQSARRDLEQLAHRLGSALDLDFEEIAAWRRILPSLATRAGRGVWSREARFLYDLQKVVNDHGREIYTVDLVEWMLSFGRRPIVRPLPFHRDVLIVHHLASAQRRLRRIRLEDLARERLTLLLDHAVERFRARLRIRFRPVIQNALKSTAWSPANLPEEVALAKLIEELLDRVVNRGFLGMGDLRDAISRNNIKLRDLEGPSEFFRGDRLLRTDRVLSMELDGVYRRGEIYLRWLQRMSALFFGTRVGRLLTLNAILPWSVAFVLLEGFDHLIGPVLDLFDGPHFHLFQPVSFTALGFLLMGLVNLPQFRRGLIRFIKSFARIVKRLVLDVPRWVLFHPVLKRVFSTAPLRFLNRWMFKPFLISLTTVGLLPLLGVPWLDVWILAGAAFLATTLLLNSRTGRDVEEILADRASRSWQVLILDLVPGLFRLVMEVFDRLLETFERIIYAIDEWLRFKSGQSPLALAGKAIVGLFWFFITYLIRIYVVLLIEPQINPIKHFPVVTVSHKLMLPFLPTLLKFLRAPLLPFGPVVANTVAGATLFLLPGIFGFLVWELKENWRLYESNRSRDLKPLIVGHHGETLPRLLRPGFHSGTIPKLHARRRRAETQALLGSRVRPVAIRKHREKLHHVEAEVRAFIERELIALLDRSRAYGPEVIRVDGVHLGLNRIRLFLLHRDYGDRLLVLDFEEHSGWLIVGIRDPEWLAEIDIESRRTFRDALAGFYRLSGVDLIREQIEEILGDPTPAYDISDSGLIIWPVASFEREVVVPLKHASLVARFGKVVSGTQSMPSAGIVPLEYGEVPLPWVRWVKIWERDRRGEGHPRPFVPEIRFFPPTLTERSEIDPEMESASGAMT